MSIRASIPPMPPHCGWRLGPPISHREPPTRPGLGPETIKAHVCRMRRELHLGTTQASASQGPDTPTLQHPSTPTRQASGEAPNRKFTKIFETFSKIARVPPCERVALKCASADQRGRAVPGPTPPLRPLAPQTVNRKSEISNERNHPPSPISVYERG